MVTILSLWVNYIFILVFQWLSVCFSLLTIACSRKSNYSRMRFCLLTPFITFFGICWCSRGPNVPKIFFRSCWTSSEILLLFSFQQESVLASIESVPSVHSVPRIHLSASLVSVTFPRQPERLLLIGIYPLALRNSGVMERSESLVDSYSRFLLQHQGACPKKEI